MIKVKKFRWIYLVVMILSLLGCDGHPLNNPHPKKETKSNILYGSFAEQPKTLDPARSYSSNETQFIAQIYEPPLQYHFLKRPYTLIPLTATELPKAHYLDKNFKPLPEPIVPSQIAYTVYRIHIKPHIFYQPHPAFAKDKFGKYLYHNLTAEDLDAMNVYELKDFPKTGTRELTADDYIYQIKRLAHPTAQSPIFGLMSEYIVGLNDFSKQLQKDYQQLVEKNGERDFLDLRKYSITGAKVVDRYTYEITIKGEYPQFLYWLAMPFFSPMPWEAELFYNQPGMEDHNISLDWYPIGTGPYQLEVNNPNRQMMLVRNPNFHGETYPSEGEAGDREQGLLVDADKALPFVDTVIFNLEKESIPRWAKFLQGYYDTSGISSDSFDQAIRVDKQGDPHLTEKLKQHKIHLYTSVANSIFYIGFNMLDDVVGGNSERARLLRQAISIALDYEEFISIFLNGRGIAAQSPIPPGIFGYLDGKAGINPYSYTWQNGQLQRKSLDTAKALLAKAGYPNGYDSKSGKPLVLNYDVPASSGPDDSARFDWLRKQFARLGIELNIRATQYNRFQEKMRTGNAQIFTWGWTADYPDPENFLFLLYGPNGKVKYQGENAANYRNSKFDSLFEQMKTLPNSPKRQKVINQMIEIVRYDAPWIFGFYPKDFILAQVWNRATKPNEMANNTIKYVRLDPILRATLQREWNQPVWWPIILIFVLGLLAIIPMILRYRQKIYRVGRQ